MAVAMATAGLFLVYVGVRNVPVVTGLREIVRGRAPAARPKQSAAIPDALRYTEFDRADDGTQFGDSGGGGPVSGNARIAEAARKYLGTPYRWGGHAPGGFDCSGLVTWVLARDIGLTTLYNNTHVHTSLWMVWDKGSRVVPRNQCAAGDLVCWAGHIGIAADNNNMIHAPDIGQVVKVSPIMGILGTPLIRRVIMPTTTGGGGMETR